MIDLEKYAYENGLDILTTTNDENGYSRNLKKVITGFECFEDAEICAKETGGIPCVIHRKDGQQFWSNTGRAFGPIEIKEQWFGVNDVVIRGVSASDWWKDEYEHLKKELLVIESPSPEKLIEIIQTFQTYSKLYDMIESLDENQQIYYEKGFPQNAEIVPIYTMRYHDFDVHEYAIAVTMDLSEPDYRDSEENA